MKMTGLLAPTLILSLLAGCASTEIAPIPGSLIYGGQPRSKLTKSPVGSTFPYRFMGDDGGNYQETYQVAPDRSLKLLSRQRLNVLAGGAG